MTTSKVWHPASNIGRVSPETGVFTFLEISAFGNTQKKP